MGRPDACGHSYLERTSTELCLAAVLLPWRPKDVVLNLAISVALTRASNEERP